MNYGTDKTKTLGLEWIVLFFSFPPVISHGIISKRAILSTIVRIYDPLGPVEPIITKVKIFI